MILGVVACSEKRQDDDEKTTPDPAKGAARYDVFGPQTQPKPSDGPIENLCNDEPIVIIGGQENTANGIQFSKKVEIPIVRKGETRECLFKPASLEIALSGSVAGTVYKNSDSHNSPKRLLVCGGADNCKPENIRRRCYKYVFDTTQQKRVWQRTHNDDLHDKRIHAAGVSGYLGFFIMGGLTKGERSAFRALSSTELHEGDRLKGDYNAWRQMSNMTFASWGGCAVQVNDYRYIYMGGRTKLDSSSLCDDYPKKDMAHDSFYDTYLNTVTMLNMYKWVMKNKEGKIPEWEDGPSMMKKRAHFMCAKLYDKGKTTVLVLGGTKEEMDNSDRSERSYRYAEINKLDPALKLSDAWKRQDIGFPKYYPSIVMIGGALIWANQNWLLLGGFMNDDKDPKPSKLYKLNEINYDFKEYLRGNSILKPPRRFFAHATVSNAKLGDSDCENIVDICN